MRALSRGFVLIAFIFAGCTTQIDIESASDFEQYLKEEMRAQRIPAMAVVLFEADEILYENYLGDADRELEVPLEADHPFLLASLSKTVTAVALLQLYDDGLFDLDDPINDYLPYEINVPGSATAITFRMLLTHTAAVGDGSAMDDQYYFGQDSPVALGDFVRNYFETGGAFYNAQENFYGFDPGQKHRYSNMGFALIGALVEAISGMDFNDYCRQQIFLPLGMEHTFWRLDEIDGLIVRPYEWRNGQYRPIEHYTFTDYPNGGLRSTGRDISRFFAAIALNGSLGGYELLDPESASSLVTPQIPSIDDEVGLCFFLLNRRYALWGHDGGEEGVATIAAFHPVTGKGVVVLANQGDADLEEVLEVSYNWCQRL